MSKIQHPSYRYSNCFKQEVLRELRSGISVSALSRKYGIGGSNTIKNWAVHFGQSDLLNKVIYVKMRTERDEPARLRAQIKELKLALADKQLAVDALSRLIEVAEEEYHIEIKKNFGTRG